MTKITANLCEQSIKDLDVIYKHSFAKTQAEAIVIAVTLARFIVEQRKAGSTICLRKANGSFSSIVWGPLGL